MHEVSKNSPPTTTTALQESISSALYNKNKFGIFLYFNKNVFVAELHKKQLRSATSAQTNRWAQPGPAVPSYKPMHVQRRGMQNICLLNIKEEKKHLK